MEGSSHDEIRRAGLVLDARCGDLLQASCHGISCLHATVKDSLRPEEIAPTFRMLAGNDLDMGMCLSRLALAVVKGGGAGDLARLAAPPGLGEPHKPWKLAKIGEVPRRYGRQWRRVVDRRLRCS